MQRDQRQRRLRLAGAATAFALLGAAFGIGAAFIGGYGWFAEHAAASRASNLSQEQAEQLAHSYAVGQLRLSQPPVAEMANLSGRPPLRRERADDTAVSDRPFVTIEARFLAGGDSASPAGAVLVRESRRAGDAWLFVFRAGGIDVPEWGTTNAVFEVQVLLSDSSGRVLQSGSALLPEIQPDTAAVSR